MRRPVLSSERTGGFNFDPATHYTNSQARQKRVSIEYLRAFADALPIYGARTRISNGIAAMPWTIVAPEDLNDSRQAAAQSSRIWNALQEPNVEETDSYSLFVKAVIHDLLVHNVAAIERLPGAKNDPKHPFWLWCIDPSRIHFNLEWTPQTDGIVPRYYDTQKSSDPNKWRPLLSRELFLVKYNSSSTEMIPRGPLEICYNMVVAWLGLNDYQFTTTSKASQEYILDIGQCTAAELREFRAYFQETVGTLIIGRTAGNHPIEVKKLGARTDDELYLKYEEKILRFLALAFQLSPRDMNITSDDSYATADVSAQSSFQFAVLPLANCWFERLNKDIVDFFFPGYRVEPGDTEPRNQKDEAETAKSLYKDSVIISLNEARLRTGYESLGEAGDTLSDGRRIDDLLRPEALGDAKVIDPDLLIEIGGKAPAKEPEGTTTRQQNSAKKKVSVE